MATRQAYHQSSVTKSSRKQFTPLTTVQIFAAGLMLVNLVLTVLISVFTLFYSWNPSSIGYRSYNPTYAITTAAVCLVLSWVIPEFLLESTRREFKKENRREQSEDIPFVLVPAVFIRYGLLAIVTMIGFILVFSGRSFYVFLPFPIISLTLMAVYFPTESRIKMWLKKR